MPLEPRAVSDAEGVVQKESLGSLRSCLVEGDAEQRNRERRVRRRALIFSILIQTAVLALLVLLPLFGKTERIALAITTPIPPYGHPPRHSAGTGKPTTGRNRIITDIFTFHSRPARPVPPSSAGEGIDGPPDLTGGTGESNGPECSWCVNIGGPISGPRPPQPVAEAPSRPRVILEPSVNPAMLIHRVEPVYPPLSRQIHKEGRVEMHARIATDGTIQSLEIVAGDPMFYQSAKEAVIQWRYKPTFLNGQPVEIDTYITVIYTLQH